MAMFENWPVSGGGIHPDTSTAGTGTKKDSFSRDTAWGGLAGNQRVTQTVVNYVPYLPWSHASGAPEHADKFTAGHKWTEAEGKVHDGTGPGNKGW